MEEELSICLECGQEFWQERDIQLCDNCVDKFDLDSLWVLHDNYELDALDFNEDEKLRERFRKVEEEFPDEPERATAIKILEEFENLLEEKNVTIPSKDREGNKEEARLYGSEYYAMEDKIVKILQERTTGLIKLDEADTQHLENEIFHTIHKNLYKHNELARIKNQPCFVITDAQMGKITQEILPVFDGIEENASQKRGEKKCTTQ